MSEDESELEKIIQDGVLSAHAQAVRRGLTIFGVALFLMMPGIFPNFRVGVLLLCMAIGELVAYYPDKSGKVVDIIIDFFKSLMKKISTSVAPEG